MHHTSQNESAQANDPEILIGDLPSTGVITFPRTQEAIALHVARQGLPVIPWHMTDGRKVPLISAWYDNGTTDEGTIRQWWRQWPDARAGMLTGSASGLSVIDLDVKGGRDGIGNCQKAGVDPDTATPLRQATLTGGRHLLFKHPEGLRNSSDPKSGVDIRADNGFIALYEPLNLDRNSLPDWPAQFTPKQRPAADPYCLDDLLAERQPVDWFQVQDALSTIPADIDRDTWFKIGAALHHASGGERFDLWSAWSKSSAGLITKVAGDRELAFQWDSMGVQYRGRRADIGTVFHLAQSHGWQAPWRIDVSADDFDDLTKPDVSSRLTFLTPTECERAPSRGYLIKGLFAPGDVGCIFGAPGAGKSLLAPFLGYAVAQGVDAFGMRTRPGKVIYVAAEDPTGMRGRVQALKAAHGDADQFRLVEGVSDLLASGSPDLAALLAAVKVESPSMIFIDTLAMAFPGLEENDAKAMGRVVAVARKLARGGAAVVLIHHDTKAEGSTPRGHSLLNGALDVALHVKREEGGIIRGKLTKNRNGTCDRDIAFTIAIENGGSDEDGDLITLPRCRVVNGSARQRTDMPTGQPAAALEVLERLQVDAGGQKVSKADWRKACASSDAVCSKDDPATRKKAFYRAVEVLTRGGHIASEDGFCWIDTGFDDLPERDGQGHSGDMSPDVTRDNGRCVRDGQGHTP